MKHLKHNYKSRFNVVIKYTTRANNTLTSVLIGRRMEKGEVRLALSLTQEIPRKASWNLFYFPHNRYLSQSDFIMQYRTFSI